MAYDEHLAARVRDACDNRPYVTERAMFGGLGFLAHGNMAAAVLGGGGIMVRVPKADYDDLLTEPGAEPMHMGERLVRGWIRIDTDGATDDDLRTWVERGLAFALTLPRK